MLPVRLQIQQVIDDVRRRSAQPEAEKRHDAAAYRRQRSTHAPAAAAQRSAHSSPTDAAASRAASSSASGCGPQSSPPAPFPRDAVPPSTRDADSPSSGSRRRTAAPHPAWHCRCSRTARQSVRETPPACSSPRDSSSPSEASTPAKMPKVVRHPLRQRAVCSGRQIDRPSRSMLRPQPLQQRPVIRQMLHIQRHRGCYMFFKLGLALRNPARNTKDLRRLLPRQRQHRIHQCVRFHQRSIKIHAQRNARVPAPPGPVTGLSHSAPGRLPGPPSTVLRCPKSWSETLKVRSSSLYRQYHGEGAVSSDRTPAFAMRHGLPHQGTQASY